MVETILIVSTIFGLPGQQSVVEGQQNWRKKRGFSPFSFDISISCDSGKIGIVISLNNRMEFPSLLTSYEIFSTVAWCQRGDRI